MNIIAFNNHQLHKSLFIQDNLDLKIDIFYQSKELNQSIKPSPNIKFVKSLLEIDVSGNAKDTYFFFSLYISKEVWQFLSLLRKNSSKVILIEETHNMLMHPYKTPGINVTPDHVIAASDLEQEAILDFYRFKSSAVSASGWIFQKKYFELMQLNELQATSLNLKNEQTNILIYLGAPIDISANSLEESYLRLELVKSIQQKHPNSQIFLKPHPLENANSLRLFFTQNRLKVNICSDANLSQKELKNFALIISSAYSQCTIDCIIQNLPLMIYAFREDNFITKSFAFSAPEPLESQNDNYVRVSNLHDGSSLFALEEFKRVNLKDEYESLDAFKDILSDNFQPADRSIELELMGYLLGESHNLPILLSDKCPRYLLPIKVLFNDPRNFIINDLDFTLFTYPMQMFISVLILRRILDENISSNTQIEYFLEELFNPAFGLIFIKESLVLRYFLMYKNLDFVMIKKDQIFLEKVEIIFTNKFFLGNIFVMILCRFLKTRFNMINKFSYRIFLLCSSLIKS